MFICEIWLFDWYFPQFCKSDMSKYGYLEVFQRVPSASRYRESTVLCVAVLPTVFMYSSQLASDDSSFHLPASLFMSERVQ